MLSDATICEIMHQVNKLKFINMVKKYSYLLLLLIVIFTGCIKDDYEETKVTIYQLADVITSESGLLLKVTDDRILYDPNFVSDVEVNIGDRLIIAYTIDEVTEDNPDYDYVIGISNFGFITVKDILTVDDVSRDTLTQEPVTINSLWIADKYLNVEFEFLGYDEQKHYFELAYDTANQIENQFVFDFIHISKETNSNESFYSILSFDLSTFDFGEAAQPYNITFTYKEGIGQEQQNFDYTPPAE